MEQTTTRTTPVYISINDVIGLLHSGFTRRIGDNNYNAEIGSIQERYDLTTEEVVDLFKDPRLKNQKVIVPKISRVIILEDLPVGMGPTEEPILSRSAEDSELSEEWPTEQILEVTVDPAMESMAVNSESQESFETEQEITF